MYYRRVFAPVQYMVTKGPGKHLMSISVALKGLATMSAQSRGHQFFNSRDSDAEQASFMGNMTRSAMLGAIGLAVLMVAGEQVAERLDTAFFNGAFILFGSFVHLLFNMTAVVAYGLGAALIVANLNPIVAVMAATGPLAPLWFLTNSAASFGGRVVHHHLIGKDIRQMSLSEVFLVCLGGQAVNSLILLVVQFFYLDLPVNTILIFKVGELVAGSVLPAPFVWYFGKRIKQRSVQD